MGKDAGGFLFWMKICLSHGPLDVVVDEIGSGTSGEKSSFIPSLFAECPLCARPEQAARSGHRDVPHLRELEI